ncbi:unnamed protein product [Prunus armeniaca]|uniref:Uncharacterized protein n=1 Tax=Prunus armeniaca TaxID=36596 RepID=A0A6J5VKQ4_PRUAR|nr:unnamed protein product [Prunus armeniaca]
MGQRMTPFHSLTIRCGGIIQTFNGEDNNNLASFSHAQSASVSKLEIQLGQLDNQVNDREKGKFPNQPEQNPRNQEHLKAIKTLRTGKTFDNRPNIEFEEEEAHIERGMQHVPSNATAVTSLVPNAMLEARALTQEPNSHESNAWDFGTLFAPSKKPPYTPPLPFAKKS